MKLKHNPALQLPIGCVSALLAAALLAAAWPGLGRTAVQTAEQPQADMPLLCAGLPAYRAEESPEQWLRREACRQQQHAREQTAAWETDPMGGVVWEK